MHSEFCFPFHSHTCLDHLPVDDDLSRWALADLHRPFVKADVGVRKVVFEGVNLSVGGMRDDMQVSCLFMLVTM